MPGDASTLLTLPLEILSEIFSHLTRREAVGAKGTCRVLRDVCRSLESEEPGRKLHHRLRLMVACSSTAEVVEFSLRGQDPPKRVAVGRAWAKSDKVKRFRRKDGPWLTGIALSPDGDRLYCQCYHELGTVVLDGKTLEYKRMYLPPQKEWKFPPNAPPEYDYTPLMENDWQIQGPEGIACAGDKVYTTFADGKVGCIYLNKEKAREPMYLAARCIDRFVHNLGTLWIEGTDPIYAFCQTKKARDCSEIYVRLGDEYEEEWRPNAPIPRWKLEGPCCFHEHATGAMQEPNYHHMIEQGLQDHVFKAYGYVAWGCDVGPDGALYVAVDRDYPPPAVDNYTLPPGRCAFHNCERRKTGVIMRVQFADPDHSLPSDSIVDQEFYTKGEHLSRPSGLTFTPDGDMLVASMDGCVSKFGGPWSPRRGEFLGVFHSLNQDRDLSKALHEMVDEGSVPAGLATRMAAALEKFPLQPLDVWAPRGQGGRVFITVHRALEKRDCPQSSYDEAGVIVCDGAGNEIDFIRDPHIAEHCNMMTGE